MFCRKRDVCLLGTSPSQWGQQYTSLPTVQRNIVLCFTDQWTWAICTETAECKETSIYKICTCAVYSCSTSTIHQRQGSLLAESIVFRWAIVMGIATVCFWNAPYIMLHAPWLCSASTRKQHMNDVLVIDFYRCVLSTFAVANLYAMFELFLISSTILWLDRSHHYLAFNSKIIFGSQVRGW